LEVLTVTKKHKETHQSGQTGSGHLSNKSQSPRHSAKGVSVPLRPAKQDEITLLSNTARYPTQHSHVCRFPPFVGVTFRHKCHEDEDVQGASAKWESRRSWRGEGVGDLPQGHLVTRNGPGKTGASAVTGRRSKLHTFSPYRTENTASTIKISR